MIAVTVSELAAVVGAILGAVVIALFLIWRDSLSIHERVARLEEIVKALRERG